MAAALSLVVSGCVADRGNAVRTRQAEPSGAAISPTTLKPSWEFRMPGPLAILVSGGRNVFVDTGQGVIAYSSTGKQLWQTAKSITNPVRSARHIYAIDSASRQVVRLNPETGAVVWHSGRIAADGAIGPMLVSGSSIVMVDDSITFVDTSSGYVHYIRWLEQHFRGDGAFLDGDNLVVFEVATGGNITTDVVGINVVNRSQKWESGQAYRFWAAPGRVVIEEESDHLPFHEYTPATLRVLSSVDGRVLSAFLLSPNEPKTNPESSSPGRLPIFISWPYANIVFGRSLFRYSLARQANADHPATVRNVESIVSQLESGALVVPAPGMIRILVPNGNDVNIVDVKTHSNDVLYPQPVFSSRSGIDVFSGELGRIILSEEKLWAADVTKSCPDAVSAEQVGSSVVVACRRASKQFLASYRLRSP